MMNRVRLGDGRYPKLRNLPHGFVSIYQAIARKAFGRYPRLPWIPFSAIGAIEKIITPGFSVWEVGAGNSTLWMADRVGSITSIEASQEWFERLGGIIKAEGIRNVDLRFVSNSESMADFSGVPDESLDLLFVDDGPRGKCLVNGFPKVRKGGYIYLDNWNNKPWWGDAANFPTVRSAELSEVKSFIDFPPGQVGVTEGLLLRKR